MGCTLTDAQRVQVMELDNARQTLAPALSAVADALVTRIADKWTMTIIEMLGRQGELRFTQIARLVPRISQKMLTQTLRQLERDGLVVRTIYPVVPPHVEYRLTPLGADLGIAFSAVWLWAARNAAEVEKARSRQSGQKGRPAFAASRLLIHRGTD